MSNRPEEINKLIEYVKTTPEKSIDFPKFIRFETPSLVMDFDETFNFLNRAINPKTMVNQIYAFYATRCDLILKRDHNKNPRQAYDYFIEKFGTVDRIRNYSKEEFDEIFKGFNQVTLRPLDEISNIEKDILNFSELLFENFNVDMQYDFILNSMQNINGFMKSFDDTYSFLTEDSKEKILKSLSKILRKGDFLKSLFNLLCLLYFKNGHDILLENHFIYYDFSSRLKLNSYQKVVLIDPSPLFIKKWLRDSYLSEIDLILVFTDTRDYQFFETYLSRKQNIFCFDLNSFYSEFQNLNLNDVPVNVLLFGNHFNSNGLKENILIHLEKYLDSELLSISVLDSDSNIESSVGYCGKVLNSFLSLEKVSLLPARIYDTSNKQRKMFVHFSKQHSEGFNVVHYSLNKKGTIQALVPSVQTYHFDSFNFEENNIRSIVNNSNKNLDRKTNRIRNKAKLFKFSEEIYFYYTSSFDEKNNSYRIGTYAIEPVFNEDGERLIGTKYKIPTTLKRSRLKNEMDVEEWLACEYPYENIKSEEKDMTSIQSEVIQVYKPFYKNKKISLRSFVYLYPELLTQYGENQINLLKDVVQTSIGDMCGEDIYFNLLNEILNMLGDSYNNHQVRALISSVIDLEIKKGHAKVNQIKQDVAEERKSTDKAFLQSREHLTIKYLSQSENIKLYKKLSKKCYSNFQYLAALIKLVTGLESNVVCALKWRDLCAFEDYNEDGKLCHLIIQRQLTNDGSEYHSFARRESYRKIPLSDSLAEILINVKENKKINDGLIDEQINDLPIIEGNDAIVNGICRVMSPNKLSVFSNKLVKQLRAGYDLTTLIPDSKKGTIETDFLNYGGDIFKSNFRHYALYKANFDIGEIDYLLGKQSETTFSRNYCDYGNDAAQLILKNKQDRFMTCFKEKQEICSRVHIMDHVHNGFKSKKNSTGLNEMILTLKAKPGTTELFVSSENGVDIEINRLEGTFDDNI